MTALRTSSLARISILPLAAALAAGLTLAACGKSNDTTQPSGGSATLSGTITDTKTTAPIASATVAIQGKTATTSSTGTYSITGLTAGAGTATVTHQGHDSASTAVTLTAGATTTTNVALTPAFAASLAGTWSGSWHNTTFGSTGAASLTATADTVAQTFQSSLTLNGTVFGIGSAPALPFSGSYTITGGAANITATSTFFGTLTLNIQTNGTVTGNLVGPMGGIIRVDFSGTATASTISLNYTVTFTGGSMATGTLTLTK